MFVVVVGTVVVVTMAVVFGAWVVVVVFGAKVVVVGAGVVVVGPGVVVVVVVVVVGAGVVVVVVGAGVVVLVGAGVVVVGAGVVVVGAGVVVVGAGVVVVGAGVVVVGAGVVVVVITGSGGHLYNKESCDYKCYTFKTNILINTLRHTHTRVYINIYICLYKPVNIDLDDVEFVFTNPFRQPMPQAITELCVLHRVQSVVTRATDIQTKGEPVESGLDRNLGYYSQVIITALLCIDNFILITCHYSIIT